MSPKKIKASKQIGSLNLKNLIISVKTINPGKVLAVGMTQYDHSPMARCNTTSL